MGVIDSTTSNQNKPRRDGETRGKSHSNRGIPSQGKSTEYWPSLPQIRTQVILGCSWLIVSPNRRVRTVPDIQCDFTYITINMLSQLSDSEGQLLKNYRQGVLTLILEPELFSGIVPQFSFSSVCSPSSVLSVASTWISSLGSQNPVSWRLVSKERHGPFLGHFDNYATRLRKRVSLISL